MGEALGDRGGVLGATGGVLGAPGMVSGVAAGVLGAPGQGWGGAGGNWGGFSSGGAGVAHGALGRFCSSSWGGSGVGSGRNGAVLGDLGRFTGRFWGRSWPYRVSTGHYRVISGSLPGQHRVPTCVSCRKPLLSAGRKAPLMATWSPGCTRRLFSPSRTTGRQRGRRPTGTWSDCGTDGRWGERGFGGCGALWGQGGGCGVPMGSMGPRLGLRGPHWVSRHQRGAAGDHGTPHPVMGPLWGHYGAVMGHPRVPEAAAPGT